MEYQFNYNLDNIEKDMSKKADYLNYKLKEFFKGDSQFQIIGVNISFFNNEYFDNLMRVEYVTANLLHWEYSCFKSEGEKKHILKCKDNTKYYFDWWT